MREFSIRFFVADAPEMSSFVVDILARGCITYDFGTIDVKNLRIAGVDR
jgi:hypothetical protein